MGSLRTVTAHALILAAIALLLLTTIGLVRPNDQRYIFDEPVVGYAEALVALDEAYAHHGASPEFLERAVAIIDDGTVYKWVTWKSATSRAEGRVPLTQNWILWSLPWFDPWLVRLGLTNVDDLFGEYQFLDYDKALRRGFGICSQLAILNADMFTRRYGIPTRVVGLKGHVVAQASLDGEEYLLDPSTGVFLPFGIAHAEANIEEVLRSYPPGSELAPFYVEPNALMEKDGGEGYRPKIYWVERGSDVAKWVIPLLMLLLGLALRRRPAATTPPADARAPGALAHDRSD